MRFFIVFCALLNGSVFKNSYSSPFVSVWRFCLGLPGIFFNEGFNQTIGLQIQRRHRCWSGKGLLDRPKSKGLLILRRTNSSVAPVPESIYLFQVTKEFRWSSQLRVNRQLPWNQHRSSIQLRRPSFLRNAFELQRCIQLG